MRYLVMRSEDPTPLAGFTPGDGLCHPELHLQYRGFQEMDELNRVAGEMAGQLKSREYLVFVGDIPVEELGCLRSGDRRAILTWRGSFWQALRDQEVKVDLRLTPTERRALDAQKSALLRAAYGGALSDQDREALTVLRGLLIRLQPHQRAARPNLSWAVGSGD